MDDTLKVKSENSTINKDGLLQGEDAKSLQGPKRKGSFKEWITTPMRKFGQGRNSMRHNKQQEKHDKPPQKQDNPPQKQNNSPQKQDNPQQPQKDNPQQQIMPPQETQQQHQHQYNNLIIDSSDTVGTTTTCTDTTPQHSTLDATIPQHSTLDATIPQHSTLDATTTQHSTSHAKTTQHSTSHATTTQHIQTTLSTIPNTNLPVFVVLCSNDIKNEKDVSSGNVDTSNESNTTSSSIPNDYTATTPATLNMTETKSADTTTAAATTTAIKTTAVATTATTTTATTAKITTTTPDVTTIATTAAATTAAATTEVTTTAETLEASSVDPQPVLLVFDQSSVDNNPHKNNTNNNNNNDNIYNHNHTNDCSNNNNTAPIRDNSSLEDGTDLETETTQITNSNTTSNNNNISNNNNNSNNNIKTNSDNKDDITDNNNNITNNNLTKSVALEDDAKGKALQKRRYVIEELVETERDYVRDLGIVVKDYMGTLERIPLPVSLEGKHKIVFGNVQQIQEWHEKTFLIELEKCLDDHETVGSVFNKYGRRLHMYVKYCENKPKSEYLVAENLEFFEELRQKLGHRLQLSDLLIKPVQRIMKYQLLLKDITKQTAKAGVDKTCLEKALELMNVIPKAANDMMMVGRLQGFEGKITAQGKLLLQELLLVCETKGEKVTLKERRVFLFEQAIIFADVIEKKKALLSDSYIYKGSIMMTKLSMEILPNKCDMLVTTSSNHTTNLPTTTFTSSHDNNNNHTPDAVCNCGNITCKCSDSNAPAGCSCLRFVLINKGKAGHHEDTIVCQAKGTSTYYKWISSIQSLLDLQGNLLKALQSPIAYQKRLNTDRSHDDSSLHKTRSQPPLKFTLSNNVANDQLHKSDQHSSVGKYLKPKMNLLKHPSLRIKKSQNSSSSNPPPSSSKNEASPCHKHSIMEGIKYTLLNLKSKSQEDLHKVVRP